MVLCGVIVPWQDLGSGGGDCRSEDWRLDVDCGWPENGTWLRAGAKVELTLSLGRKRDGIVPVEERNPMGRPFRAEPGC